MPIDHSLDHSLDKVKLCNVQPLSLFVVEDDVCDGTDNR